MTIAMMVDWETLDSKPSTVVRSLGWAVFCYETKNVLACGYVDGIDVSSQLKEGRTISWDTLVWWSRQSDEARAAMFTDGYKYHYTDALLELKQTYKRLDCQEIWGNGSDFDTAITASLLELTGWERFWNFRKQRCYREFMIGRQKIHKPEVSHHAMHDAIAQAKNVLEYI